MQPASESSQHPSSVETCIRDEHTGVEKIYNSGAYKFSDWFAQWHFNRTLSGFDNPFGIDNLDDRVTVMKNGFVHIQGGSAILQRSPRLQISAGGSKFGFGNAVEMTGYAYYFYGGEQRGNSGLNMAIQMSHPSSDADCDSEGPSYLMQINRLSGVASFQKEFHPDDGEAGWIRSSKVTNTIAVFTDELPIERWIGVKFIIRNLGESSILLELYIDLGGGGDGDVQIL